MKIPSKLRMFGEDWKVIKNRNLSLTDGLWGQMKGRSREILLEVGHASIDTTLLHEIIHAIDRNMMIGLEEEQVTRLSSGLYAAIRDNKLNFLED